MGLFLGEYATVLKPIGDAFIMLLQMAVLPYFLITLMLGLGTITLEQAKVLGLRGAGVLAPLWTTCFVVAAPAILTTSAVSGLFAFDSRRFGILMVVSLALLSLAVAGTRLVLDLVVESHYTKPRLARQRRS